MQTTPAHGEAESPFESLKEWYFSFDGRINRKQFIVRYLIILIVCSSVAMAFKDLPEESLVKDAGLMVIVVAMIWSGLSVYIRRLHDANMSGWWVLLPFGRDIFALFFSGTKGDNKYGKQPDPKAWF